MERLFLVDGMSHLYRAYYAIRGLTNRQGMSTNAVFGFASMIRKLIQDEDPDFLAIAFESEGKTVRHSEFPDYKATRPRMPGDLAEQIPYVERLCSALHIPVLAVPGYEADDVIGTLTRLGLEHGVEVVIVTIDKDMFQLVNDRVSVLDTRSMMRFGPAEVEEKWGVRPDQIPDVLSLVGDSSDNIPGAPGIGEKGAKTLIARFGSLTRLLEQVDHVEPKRYRESLRNHSELVLKSRRLIQIFDDLPLELNLPSLRISEPNLDALRDLYQELGFSSLLKEISSEGDPEYPESIKVHSARELVALVDQLSGRRVGVALGSSGTGDRVRRLGIAPEGRQQVIEIDLDSMEEGDKGVLDLLSVPRTWFVHDLKPLLLGLKGIRRSGIAGRALDTMLMAYLLDPNQRDFSLDRLALEHLGQTAGAARDTDSGLTSGELCRRAAWTRELADRFESDIESQGLGRVLREIEMPLVEVLVSMEQAGVRIDVDLLADLSRSFDDEIEKLRARIFADAGETFNLNSPRQLAHVLFENLQLPSSRKTGKAGHLSTGIEVLEELAGDFEIVGRILEYRELAKLKSTYVDALPRLVDPRTGRIHTSYNQMVASTGRLSSSNPNLQNIPIRTEQGRQIRRAFLPAEGALILSADYSQIELRVLAHLSQDPVLTEAFLEGEDIHQRTAREVFGADSSMDHREQRRRAKVINFGIIYGLSAFGLAKSLKIERAEAQTFIDSYFKRYAGVRAWIERTSQDASERGFVKTLFGRIRQIPEINSRNRNLREFARRTAINAPIQGTAADLIKLAMVAIHRRMDAEGWRSRLIMQVHDELVFEAFSGEEDRLRGLVKGEMEGVASLNVPLKVDVAVGRTWYDAK